MRAQRLGQNQHGQYIAYESPKDLITIISALQRSYIELIEYNETANEGIEAKELSIVLIGFLFETIEGTSWEAKRETTRKMFTERGLYIDFYGHWGEPVE